MRIADSIGTTVAHTLGAVMLLTCLGAAQPSGQTPGTAPALPAEVPVKAEVTRC